MMTPPILYKAFINFSRHDNPNHHSPTMTLGRAVETTCRLAALPDVGDSSLQLLPEVFRALVFQDLDTGVQGCFLLGLWGPLNPAATELSDNP